MTISVVIADDQSLIRGGFRSLIEGTDDLVVVGEAANGLEALEVVRRTVPDVVLMDIRMPDLDGIDATRRIAAEEELSGVRVLVLTTFELDDYVLRALRAGASGFISKGAEPAELLDAVRLIAHGDALLSPKATRSLISRLLAEPVRVDGAVPDLLLVLTEREREIVALVAIGLSNDEIADRLQLATSTVKTHVNRAMTKLDARDRAQLVVVAYRTGLVTATP